MPQMSPSHSQEPVEILALFNKRPTDVRPGLDRIFEALDLLGRPSSRTPKITVAGTNGKGTTCGMIWRLLALKGLRVGLFTSPHLVEFRERISVSGCEVSNKLLVNHINSIKAKLPQKLWDDLTFFEINTILAFLVFDDLKTDLNVLEVGLGGRLDCVNVYDPEVSVITSIGLDHTEYLGSSLASIAREKAGIMRPGRPIVFWAHGWSDKEADDAVVEAATQTDAICVRASDPSADSQPQSLLSRPRFIRQNFQLARQAVHEYLTRNAASREPLCNVDHLVSRYDSPTAPWPVTFTGRFDCLTVSRQATKIKVLLDVCHNPHGAKALAAGIDYSKWAGSSGKLNCLISILSDKDVTGIWGALEGKIKEVIPFRINSPRSWAQPPQEMREVMIGGIRESFSTAWKDALERKSWQTDVPWLICGSVAAVGEVLDYWLKEGWQIDRVLPN